MKQTFTIPAITLGLFGLLVFSYSASSETKDDVTAQLTTDLVQEKDGKFILDRVQLCQVFRPEELGGGATKPFQVKAHMEAPAKGVISRDRFIALGSELAFGLRVNFANELIKGLTPEQALDALQCKSINAVIGTVDFEVNVSMTRDGVQLEMTETESGEKERRTTTWDQILGP